MTIVQAWLSLGSLLMHCAWSCTVCKAHDWCSWVACAGLLAHAGVPGLLAYWLVSRAHPVAVHHGIAFLHATVALGISGLTVAHPELSAGQLALTVGTAFTSLLAGVLALRRAEEETERAEFSRQFASKFFFAQKEAEFVL